MAYMKDSSGRRLDSFKVLGASDVGTPASFPSTPVARDVDSTFNVNNTFLITTTVNKKTRVRRARINVVPAGGDISVGAYDSALNRKCSTGAIGNGPGGFPLEVALPPTDLDPGMAYIAMSTSSGTASFSAHSTFGQQVGALLKTTAHPLPTSITGATLQTKSTDRHPAPGRPNTACR
jgi:hypothetical protein